MNTVELIHTLQQMRNPQTRANVSLKAGNSEEHPDISIEANENGILVLCEFLLRSIESTHLAKDSLYDIPEDLFEGSDVWISHIRIEEGNQNPEKTNNSRLAEGGCILALVGIGIVFITGLVTAFSWLANFL